MVEQLDQMWLKMRQLEVFRVCELANICDCEVPFALLASYVVALVDSGYVVEISGRMNPLKHGRYRLLRDTGKLAPILLKGISILSLGQYIWVDYAIYDANLDAYFPLVKEVA